MGGATMDEFIKFNNQTAGRDKVFRLAQYTCRILWYALDKRKSCQGSANKTKRLDESLGLMRRLLRWGRFVESLHSALPVLTSVSDPVIRLTCVLSRISNSCFMLIDHIVCLDKLGILPPSLIDSSRWDRTSTRFWLYSITLGLLRDFYEIRRIYKEEFQHFGGGSSSSSSSSSGKSRRRHYPHHHHHAKPLSSLSEEDNNKKSRKAALAMAEFLEQSRLILMVLREHADVAVDTLKNVCDIFLPLNSLGFVKLNPAVVGLLGVVSTVASALPQINPMIKMVPAT